MNQRLWGAVMMKQYISILMEKWFFHFLVVNKNDMCTKLPCCGVTLNTENC